MQYIIYCDESADKGRFYSNFYGGALIKASEREMIEGLLQQAKAGIQGEAKWTKVNEHDESAYIEFAGQVLKLIEQGNIKMRMMFTQNIHNTDHVLYEEDSKYYKLYYQFIKHAFGLQYCNQSRQNIIHITVYLDDAPDTEKKLDNFKNYLSSLSYLPEFFEAKVLIEKENIAEVNSKHHIILQAVDLILGAIQFRLNEFHKEIPPGKRRRGKRTRSKERVYRFINKRLREIYPGFNIGTTTGGHPDETVRWQHAYRHWCFKPYQSVMDRTRGKKHRRRR